MNIGFDAKRAFHNTTGLGNYGRKTIRFLHQFYPENQYHLYTPEFNPDKNFLTGVGAKNIFVHTPNGLINKTFPSYWRSKGIVKDLEKDAIQIYHGLTNELPFGIEKTKIKTVVSIHDAIFMRFPDLYPAVDRKIYERKWKHAIAIADKIIAVSEQTKRDILEFFNADEKKIELIYTSVTSKFATKPDKAKRLECLKKYKINDIFIFSVGRIEERKNLKVVIEALALMNENDRPLFVLAGKKTAYFAELKSLIEKNKLEKNIMLLEQVSDEELNCLYHSAMAVVYPSVFEGFGLPIVEAQSAGIPVICSNEPIMHETSGEASLFANAHSPEDWKEKINYLASNQELIRTLIAEGLENVKRFEDDVVTKQLYNLYQTLI